MTVLVDQQKDLSTNNDQQRDLSTNGLVSRWFRGQAIKTRDRFNCGTVRDAATLNMTQCTLSAIYCCLLKVIVCKISCTVAMARWSSWWQGWVGTNTFVNRLRDTESWLSGKQERPTPRPGLEPERDVEMAEKCLFWIWGGADVSPISPHLRKPTPEPGLGMEQPNSGPLMYQHWI